MDLFTSMDVAAASLFAQKTRLNAVAANIANASTTRTAEGGPYRRTMPIFEAVPLESAPGVAPTSFADRLAGAVRTVVVKGMWKDPSEGRLVYDPGHPDARPDGFVAMPNIEVITEMVDMITASRTYEASLSTLRTARSMITRAIDLLR